METVSDATRRLQAEGYTGNWFATPAGNRLLLAMRYRLAGFDDFDLADAAAVEAALQFSAPGVVVLAGVAVDGLVDTAVDGKVALLIAVVVQLTHHDGTRDRQLVDRRRDFAAFDDDGLRFAGEDGEKLS